MGRALDATLRGGIKQLHQWQVVRGFLISFMLYASGPVVVEYMKITLSMVLAGLLLVSDGSAFADSKQCLGGASSQATCVEGTNRIYGQGNQGISQEMMKSDSGASTLQGQSASKLIQGSGVGSGGINGLLNGGPLQQKRFGNTFNHGASGRDPNSGNASHPRQGSGKKGGGNGDAQNSRQNSLGEHVDYFGQDTERDVHGSLVTCLNDSFGHQVCM